MLALYLGIYGALLCVCGGYVYNISGNKLSPFLLCAYVVVMVPCQYFILFNRCNILSFQCTVIYLIRPQLIDILFVSNILLL